VGAISADQVFCSHDASLALCFDFCYDRELCVAYFVDFDFDELSVSLDASLGIAEQVCL
jgi:hypothetical protein